MICLLAGCNSTPIKPLIYTPATELGTKQTSLEKNFKVGNFADKRTDKELDVLFEATAIEEIERVLEESLSQNANSFGQQYTITGSLYQLEWEIPDYEAMIRKVFAASLLTGGLGGAAYGTTSTQVFSRIDIEYDVRDPSGSTIFTKRYKIEHEEIRKKLDSDTPGAKSEIASQALSKSINLFLTDLSKQSL